VTYRFKAICARGLGGLVLAAHKLVGQHSVMVRGGLAVGLRLDVRRLPIRHVHGYHLIRGSLEHSVQAALRDHVRPGAVVYDIGANVGFFSLLCARLTGPHGRVEAFEPVPTSAAAVSANAALNGFSTISVHRVAVSDHDGRGELLINRENSWSHLAERGWHPKTRRRLLVDRVVLDDEIARGAIPPPDVIKIDIEGSEIAALRGLARTLRSRRVVIVCELHETNAELLALMTDLHYTVENLDGPAPVVSAGPIHVLAYTV
jgi:FkbM family methyltransferase